MLKIILDKRKLIFTKAVQYQQFLAELYYRNLS